MEAASDAIRAEQPMEINDDLQSLFELETLAPAGENAILKCWILLDFVEQ
jgi:hypothetical protein